MAGRKYWSRDLIVVRLQRCKSPPTVAQFRRSGPDTPSYLTIIREFGSWEAALEAAGFNGYGKRGRRANPRSKVKKSLAAKP